MVRHETKVLRSPIQEDPPTAVLKNRAIAQELSPAGVKDQDFLLLAAPAPLEYEDYDGHESMVDLIRCFLRVLFSSTTTYVEHRRSMSPTVRDLVMALELKTRQQQRPRATETDILSQDPEPNLPVDKTQSTGRRRDEGSGHENYLSDSGNGAPGPSVHSLALTEQSSHEPSVDATTASTPIAPPPPKQD